MPAMLFVQIARKHRGHGPLLQSGFGQHLHQVRDAATLHIAVVADVVAMVHQAALARMRIARTIRIDAGCRRIGHASVGVLDAAKQIDGRRDRDHHGQESTPN